MADRSARPFDEAAAAALEADLRRTVRGEVHFDGATRGLYASDASNYRQVPIGVVTPVDIDDVVAAVAACRDHGAPLLSPGGGTSLAGQCCNVAVVLDFSRHLHRVIEVDPDGRRARVQPGTVLDDLRSQAEEHGLTFGPDPSTHNRCTLGGMIGNNSCGVHSIMAGRTSDNIESLDVLTYAGLHLQVGATSEDDFAAIIAGGGRRGEIYAALRGLRDRHGDEIRRRFPKLPRRVSGFNLDELLPENGGNVARALVGTEGTCVIVLEATTRLVPSPPKRALLVIGYADVFDAADAVPLVLSHGVIGLEGIDHQQRHPRQGLGDVGAAVTSQGRRLAAGGVRRRHHRRGRRAGATPDDGARTRRSRRGHEAPRRRTRRGAPLAAQGVGSRGHRQRAGTWEHLGGLGGRRRPPRAARRVPPRLPRAARPSRP